MAGHGGPVGVGDGGLTGWTALTDNREELGLVSCASTERLLALGRSRGQVVWSSTVAPPAFLRTDSMPLTALALVS